MASKRDYYDILGIKKGASKDEIKSAYRSLAKKYHPDVNKAPDAESKFKEVQEAYDVLYDDNKRATYDQFGHAAFEQGTNQGGGFGGQGFSGGGFGDVDLGDLFGSFFGGSTRSRRSRSQSRRGRDVTKRIKINFMDAINGRDIDLSLSYDKSCPSCHGEGGTTSTCSQCGGTGYVMAQRNTFFGVMQSQEVCPLCGGKGKVIVNRCSNCGGKGHIHVKNEKHTIHIPAGINYGQQLRIQGKGEVGLNGGENGDFYLEIFYDEHPIFKREKYDIHITIPISFIDASLGVDIDVPTVYNNVTLHVPSGTQPNQTFRLKEKGVKDSISGRIGDQYVHLDIKTPDKLSRKQKDLLNQFKDEEGSDTWLNRFKKAFKR